MTAPGPVSATGTAAAAASKPGWVAHGAAAPPGSVAGAWLQSAAGALWRNSPVSSGSSGRVHWPVVTGSESWAASGNRHSAVAPGSCAPSAGAGAVRAAGPAVRPETRTGS
ncbi:hypothetical protein [Streptomyces sp. NBC_01343]|uniref:hypothetical protein n=1 Tax=Streptomyces sp. NBC_01343 TaxID=2903832 RepID=UPI003FA3D76D